MSGHGGARENSGGRRAGAGRPAGSGWRASVGNLRTDAVHQLNAIVGSDKDPLAVVIAMACDETVDRGTRLGACSIALPYLYPKLSASVVQQNHTVTHVNANDLLDRIAERITRQNGPVTIEAEPTGSGVEPTE